MISPRSRHSRMVCLTACAEGGPLPSASSTSSAESWESTLWAGGAAEKYEAIDLVVFAFQVPTSSKAQYYGVNSNSESAATILKLDVITKHSKPLHAVASSTKKTRSLSALDHVPVHTHESSLLDLHFQKYMYTMIMSMHVQPSHCIPPHSVACAGLPDPRYIWVTQEAT